MSSFQKATSAFLTISAFALSGCGIVSDRANEYVEADAGKSFVLPSGYEQANIKSLYPIPEIENQRKLPREYVLPEPPDATAVLDENPYAVERLDNQVWLKLYTAPGKVWPLLDFFWREYGVDIQAENISEGTLTTVALSEGENIKLFEKVNAELEEAATTGLQLRAELKQGVRRNTTEIHLTSQGANLSSVEATVQLESAVLKVIGDYLTSSEIENRHSLLATDIESQSRVRLLEGENNQTYLEIDLSYDRAWSEVDQALKSAEVVIADLNRSEGVFFLHDIEPNKDSGSLFGFVSGSDKAKSFNYEVRLLDEGKGVIRMEVQLLNPELDEAKHNELVSLVFEHIS